jgi:hypothetical protein
MGDPDDGYHKHIVSDHVNNPLVAHPDAPQVIGACELGNAFGARMVA